MANFGIGLGAFTQGLSNGIGLGQRWSDMQRQNQEREAVDKVAADTKASFDAEVAAGKAQPNQYVDYWRTKALPQLMQIHIQQGRPEMAAAFQKWGEGEEARQGTAAFGKMLTAGNFDDAGAAMGELFKVKGYVPSGYVYVGGEAVTGPNGQGYKVTWRAPDGKSYSQQFGSIDEMRRAAASALNPQAVGQAYIEQGLWDSEDKRKLGLYRAQKEIDAQPGLQPLPAGFRWNGDRTAYEPIPGGPATPQYKADVVKATQPPPAPVVTEIYDEKTGQPQKAIVSPGSGSVTPIAGTKAPVRKPIPPSVQNAEAEDLYAVQTVTGVNNMLGRFGSQIDSGKLQLGGLTNVINGAKNAVGLSSEESRNYASFIAGLEKLRNDSLRLNKGVQTEGDAQRAWNELVANINDPKVVKQRIEEIARYNNQAAEYHRNMIQHRRQENGLDPMDIDRVIVSNPSDGSKDQSRAQPSQGGTAPSVPPSAIAALRGNPQLADQFDAKYGRGAAARVLGGQ